MRALHRTYSDYWEQTLSSNWCCVKPEPPSRRTHLYDKISHVVAKPMNAVSRQGRTMDEKSSATPSMTEMGASQSADVENTERTDIIITYRELSWDFMPPDVVRPLAMTHLGPLVVMSIRLRMEWRN